MIYLLTGDSFLIDQKILEIKNEFLQKYPDGLVENVDGEDSSLPYVTELVSSTSLFSQNKLVVIKRLGNNKQLAPQIEQIFEKIVDTVGLVLIDPKPDKRSSYYKFLKSNKNINHIDAKLDNVANWIQGEVKSLGGNISGGEVQYLIDKTGPDPSLLYFELRKLVALDPKITKENIDKLVQTSFMSSIFDLVNAIFEHDKKKAMSLYEQQHFLGTQPIAIIGMIAWQLHLFALIKSTNKSTSEISSQSKISAYALDRSASVTKNLDLADINQMIQSLLELDHKAKTSSIDIDEALKNWILLQT